VRIRYQLLSFFCATLSKSDFGSIAYIDSQDCLELQEHSAEILVREYTLVVRTVSGTHRVYVIFFLSILSVHILPIFLPPMGKFLRQFEVIRLRDFRGLKTKTTHLYCVDGIH
jgi:hypothetical protein